MNRKVFESIVVLLLLIGTMAVSHCHGSSGDEDGSNDDTTAYHAKRSAVQHHSLVFLPGASHAFWKNQTALELLEDQIFEMSEALEQSKQRQKRRESGEDSDDDIDLQQQSEHHLVDTDPEVLQARYRALLKKRNLLLNNTNSAASHFSCKGNHCNKKELMPLGIVCRTVTEPISKQIEPYVDYHRYRNVRKRSFFSHIPEAEADLVKPRFHHEKGAVLETDRVLLDKDTGFEERYARKNAPDGGDEDASDGSSQEVNLHWHCIIIRSEETPKHMKFEEVEIECQHHDVEEEYQGGVSNVDEGVKNGGVDATASRRREEVRKDHQKKQKEVLLKESSKLLQQHLHQQHGDSHEALVATEGKDRLQEHLVDQIVDLEAEMFSQEEEEEEIGGKNSAEKKAALYKRKCRIHFEIVNYGPFLEKMALLVMILFIVSFVLIMTVCVGSQKYKEEIARAKVNKKFSSWIQERGLQEPGGGARGGGRPAAMDPHQQSVGKYLLDQPFSTSAASSSSTAPPLPPVGSRFSQSAAYQQRHPPQPHGGGGEEEATPGESATPAYIVDEKDGRYSLPPELQHFANKGAAVFQQDPGTGDFRVFHNPEGLTLGELRARAKAQEGGGGLAGTTTSSSSPASSFQMAEGIRVRPNARQAQQAFGARGGSRAAGGMSGGGAPNAFADFEQVLQRVSQAQQDRQGRGRAGAESSSSSPRHHNIHMPPSPSAALKSSAVDVNEGVTYDIDGI